MYKSLSMFLEHVINTNGNINNIIFNNAYDDFKEIDKEYDDLIKNAKVLENDYQNHKVIAKWVDKKALDNLVNDSKIIRKGGKVITFKEIVFKYNAMKDLTEKILPMLTELISRLSVKGYGTI